MKLTVGENKKIGEKLIHFTHKSGLEVYFIPKNHSTCYAAIATNFGSIDRVFEDENGNVVELTDGIAHFLEHKMFENEDGRDAFEDYAMYGGNANAYTSEDKTMYLFSATDNFCENLQILLHLVTHPYFTKETVEKEQGIIGQEIKMYDDTPNSRLFFGTMECLYHVDPVKYSVTGTVDSIAKITPETLYKIHKLFYNLRNMVLCISGDINIEDIEKVLDDELEEAPPFTAKSILPTEPYEIVRQYKKERLEVSMPLYEVAYKLDASAVSELRDYISLDVALSIIFDPSSEFWNNCYNNGIFNSLSLNLQTVRNNTAFIEISGSAEEPEKVFEAVKTEIDRRLECGFSDEEFESMKKVIYADAVTDFETTESVVNLFMDFYFEGSDILTYPDEVASVDKQSSERLFKALVSNDRACLSVIEPISKEG